MDGVRILIVDDHAMFRQALRLYLNSQSGIETIGEAASADEGLQQAVASCPDVILLDITMPGGSGLAILPQLRQRCPDSRVLMVTMHNEPSYLRAALAAGALGYVVKTSTLPVLVEAIRAVRRNETCVDPSMRDISIQRSTPARGPETAPIARLSERERQVLNYLAHGLRYQAIAEKIGVSVKTVETYRGRLKAKLGFKTREDLMRLALEMGIFAESPAEPLETVK
jgi:DNA-binding NarL/FixJ family response regulator